MRPEQHPSPPRPPNRRTALAGLLAFSGASQAAAQPAAAPPGGQAALTVQRNGAASSTLGAATNFTGAVRVDNPFRVPTQAHLGGGTVSFAPGARTNWHTHPLGQTLIVTAGLGWVQHWGGPVLEIRPGDVVWIPPDVKHWHGATATTGMSHLALAEQRDGRSADWLEPVSDAQYRP